MKRLISLLYLIPCTAFAGPATVVDATATQSNRGWTFSVTIKHADTGWDHYADGWGVYAPDGTELGYRVLAHPHVNEQPFTRSLSGVDIPDGMTTVVIKPRDLVHGVGQDFILELPAN
jgi:hypothetical protein